MNQCRICDSKISRRKLYDHHMANPLAYRIKQILRGKGSSNETFTGLIAICSRCGHGTMEEPPTNEQLQKYYEKKYWSDRPKLTEEVKGTKNAFKNDLRARTQILFVKEYINSITKVLEIGAGPAFASLALKETFGQSLKLNVCEPGKHWAEHYKENSIVNLAPYFPFYSKEIFDYIHTSHWLEHMVDLDDTILELYRFLREKGIIFVEVPNTEYQYWDLPILDTPHIQFFTTSSLVKIFEKHGFECVKVGTFGQTFYQKHMRVPLTAQDYNETKNGFWIRALFRKK